MEVSLETTDVLILTLQDAPEANEGEQERFQQPVRQTAIHNLGGCSSFSYVLLSDGQAAESALALPHWLLEHPGA
jgi:hypothetical protein